MSAPVGTLGGRCPRTCCAGTVGVYATIVRGAYRIRFLHCTTCGAKPASNKQIVPLEFAPARANKKNSPPT